MSSAAVVISALRVNAFFAFSTDPIYVRYTQAMFHVEKGQLSMFLSLNDILYGQNIQMTFSGTLSRWRI